MTHLRHLPLGSGGGDDCAVLEVPAGMRIVLSVDTAVEGVHFRRAWLTPEEVGYRATTAALSDIAAMAAVPVGVAIAMTLPDAWRDNFLSICDGIGDATRAVGARIIGGDLTHGKELSLTLPVVGHAALPLSR